MDTEKNGISAMPPTPPQFCNFDLCFNRAFKVMHRRPCRFFFFTSFGRFGVSLFGSSGRSSLPPPKKGRSDGQLMMKLKL